MSGGIINPVASLHLVGYFYWVSKEYYFFLNALIPLRGSDRAYLPRAPKNLVTPLGRGAAYPK